LVAAGCSSKQVASRMKISERTVKWHVSRLLARFQVPNRAALVRAADMQHLLRRMPFLRP
jgi:DNA-binding NarL/FixJ family response regulator